MVDAEILYTDGNGGVFPLEVQHYPSGEPLIRQMPVHAPTRILLRPTSMQTFVAAMFWVDALVARGIPVPAIVLPNVPGARQDRINLGGDVLFTARSVAGMLNARNFPSVTILDPHSDVIAALIDRSRVVYADLRSLGTAEFGDRTYSGVIAPDAGAEKRAGRVAKGKQLPLFHAWKVRNVEDGAISGFGIEPVAPGHYLIVDDLCDGGGTFTGLAGVLAEHGCSADLFITHGLFTKGTAPLLDVFRSVFCTDSTVGAKPGVVVLPTCATYLGVL